MRKWLAAAVMLGAITATWAGGGAPATQAVDLRAHSARLQAALAQRDQQIEALRRDLAEVKSALAELRAAIAELSAKASGAAAAAPSPAGPAAPQPGHKLDIRVAKDGWGDTGLVDIEKVLRSAAEELWVYFPQRSLHTITVHRSHSGPITLFQRGPGGEYVVKLDSQDRLWSQMAYQFAHEFCHVLTNYSEKTSPRCKWFEESLCEMASIFAVRAMAQTWRTRPPWPNWKGYAPSLGKYADDLLLPPDKRFGGKASLAEWYRANAEALAADACDRKRNKVIAVELLTLFEKSPQSWEAVGYLNFPQPDESKTFEAYLANWHRNAPQKHQAFIRQVAGLFGVEIEQPDRRESTPIDTTHTGIRTNRSCFRNALTGSGVNFALTLPLVAQPALLGRTPTASLLHPGLPRAPFTFSKIPRTDPLRIPRRLLEFRGEEPQPWQ